MSLHDDVVCHDEIGDVGEPNHSGQKHDRVTDGSAEVQGKSHGHHQIAFDVVYQRVHEPKKNKLLQYQDSAGHMPEALALLLSIFLNICDTYHIVKVQVPNKYITFRYFTLLRRQYSTRAILTGVELSKLDDSMEAANFL